MPLFYMILLKKKRPFPNLFREIRIGYHEKPGKLQTLWSDSISSDFQLKKVMGILEFFCLHRIFAVHFWKTRVFPTVEEIQFDKNNVSQLASFAKYTK